MVIPATAVFAALAVAQGCGTGEYEKRMEAKTWARKTGGGGAAAVVRAQGSSNQNRLPTPGVLSAPASPPHHPARR